MNISSHGSVRKKIIALLISLCMAASFVPSVFAASDTGDAQTVDSAEFIVPDNDPTTLSTDPTTQATDPTTQATESTTLATESTTLATESTTQATESTTLATESTTQATESTTQTTKSTEPTKSMNQASTVNSAKGFDNVETNGGVLFVGTARTPKEGGGISTVKFVYSSSLNLNDKSLALINKELAACGVTIPNGMIYVSTSDIVSDSQLMNKTSEQQAVFAVGSPSAPTVLTAYQPYGSVEESFERLFRGYIFSITSYTSLRPVLDGREEVTLSDDGQTASTSIVMSEDYVEKVINGKKIKILMINSELKYYFRAPKLTFVKDEDYNVSDSDIVYHYPTRSTTDPSDTLTTAGTQSTKIPTDPFFDDESTDPTTDTSQTSDTTESSNTTESTYDNDSTTSTDDTDPFWDDDTTHATHPTNKSTEDDWQSTTTDNTHSNATYTEPSRMIPYAHPIDGGPIQNPTNNYPTVTVPSNPTDDFTTDPTTEPTSEPTSRITLPTNTQPTEQDPIIDPFNQREQHTVGEAYINTRRLPLNIRTGPGLNYMVINVLPRGTRLTVLDTSNSEWYMVRLQNLTVGYAYSYYIKFI